jgi:signal transduction histidine kinase
VSVRGASRGDQRAERGARRPVQAALIVLICVVLVLVGVGAFAADRIYSEGNHRFIDQAGPFFAVTEDLAIEMLNQETGVRGYVITADPKTLAPYRQGKKYAKVELALIAKDQSFGPRIPAHLRAMRRQVRSLQAFFAGEIALVRSGPAGQRRAQAAILSGKGHFDHLRAASRALIDDASDVIKRSHRQQHSTLVSWLVFLAVLGLLAVAIAVALLFRVPRRLSQLFREERVARREAEQSAEAARALAHIREAVLLLDVDDRIRYWNPTAQDWFGLASAEHAERLGVLHQLDTVAGSSGTLPITIDGTERWLSCVASPFDGGRVLVFRDVSDDHRLERLRSEFVATAAHELRTPLAAVYGAVRTLRHRPDPVSPEMTDRFLEMIENESDRLKLVTDQLLASAQIDAADLRLRHQTVDAVGLCESVVSSAELRKPDTIELAVETSSPEMLVDADPDRLRQVIANLIDNAIKYSPSGGRIAVRVHANGRKGAIEIADHGIGIPADEHERIFEKFYRLDPSMTHGVGGSGLGLYISRELVRQMGGELSVASSHGTGSTFSITLPLATRDGDAPAPAERSEGYSLADT